MTNKEKRRARHHAYLMAYQWDLGSLEPQEVSLNYWEEVDEPSFAVKEVAERLFRKTVENVEKVDSIVSKYLKRGWTVSRLLPVDRSILRVATYELLSEDLSPAEAVINDAVEFAKLYGEDPKSPAFINALLDRIRENERG
ncbi:transcription antitermination factor NusB [Thermovibrio sp.]